MSGFAPWDGEEARALLAGLSVGPCSIIWQLQQRPDKSGKSDRFHKVRWGWGGAGTAGKMEEVWGGQQSGKGR